jgi:hypothetical protein
MNNDLLMEIGQEDVRLEATIILPSIKSLNASGMADITFTNLKSEKLSLFGMGNIFYSSINCQFKFIQLVGHGNTVFSLNDLKVNNAEVYLNNQTKGILNILGGDIYGIITGSSELIYYGQANSQNVEVLGSASIIHR